MRPSYLDSKVGVYGLWALMLVAVIVLFFVGLGIRDAFSAEKTNRCFIGRVAFDQQTITNGHPFLVTLPPDLSRQFIINWNALVQAAPISVRADSVSIYGSKNQAPFYRIGFFEKGCLVEVEDISEEGFWKVIALTHGPGRMKI